MMSTYKISNFTLLKIYENGILELISILNRFHWLHKHTKLYRFNSIAILKKNFLTLPHTITTSPLLIAYLSKNKL